MSNSNFLRDFYRALADRPLEPEEDWYVDLYTNAASDPIEQLTTGIEWAEMESVHLLSGFRGTGKSTELRRLRQRLHQTGRYKVVLCDMQKYLNLASTIDISEFLITMSGVFSDELRNDPDLLGADPKLENYWTRLTGFLRDTQVDLSPLQTAASVGPIDASLQTSLRRDPTFRQILRDTLRGQLGALVADVRMFMKDCVQLLRNRHGEDIQVVLLFDSVEQIRGTSLSNAEDVYASVEALFSNHAENLFFEELHVVYTVPPWLKIRSPGIGGEFSGSQLLPCVTVKNRDGTPNANGLGALERVVSRRGNWQQLLGSRARLDQLLLASGGYLRDLFRLLQAVLRRAHTSAPNGVPTLPVSDEILELALHELRNGYLPLAHADAQWLSRVRETHDPELGVHRAQDQEPANLYNLSRFFDTHMVLCYRDGAEWYDIHPLLIQEVERQMNRRA